ncbi:MAG: patatin-like phospholipase family protein [Thermoflexus sp.]|nr:patatin-like phospholipase family protein [Thermoflexus sp.]MDT7885038.1 patatin-like phospholipase family protein [Thermoflexus sp.]MDT7948957.1 patatin-like phospholipase family protein [Thermoflexus sp.]
MGKRALVLSGGGGRGAYEVGVIRALYRAGWIPEILVGTSIGAVNAAALAAGWTAERLVDFWLGLRSHHVHRPHLRIWRSLFTTEPLRATLRRHIDFERLNDPDNPRVLLVLATDLRRGCPVVFASRPVPKALAVRIGPEHLLASCSIPYVYPATPVERSVFWDGAVMANTPLNAAIEAGADEIVAVLLAPMPGQAGGWPLPRHPLQALALVLDLALLATFENDYRQLEAVNQAVRRGHPLKPTHREIRCHVVAPAAPLPLSRILRYDPAGTRALIAQGEADARAILDRLEG